MDFRRQGGEHVPVFIDGVAVERVSEFLGVHIEEDLKWNTHTTFVRKKAQQQLCWFHCLKNYRVLPSILRLSYNSYIESVLSGCVMETALPEKRKTYRGWCAQRSE